MAIPCMLQEHTLTQTLVVTCHKVFKLKSRWQKIIRLFELMGLFSICLFHANPYYGRTAAVIHCESHISAGSENIPHPSVPTLSSDAKLYSKRQSSIQDLICIRNVLHAFWICSACNLLIIIQSVFITSSV